MKIKKHNSKNLKIKTRIAIAALTGIAIALILTFILAIVFKINIPDIYNVSKVNTDDYSLLNQIQWNETIQKINNTLSSDQTNSEKIEKINSLTEGLDNLETKYFITSNGEILCTNSDKDSVLNDAKNIVDFDIEQNLTYLGDNGLVISNHIVVNDNHYAVVITNPHYTVIPKTDKSDGITNIIFGQSSFFVLIIIIILILSIIITSIISSKTITEPMERLVKGANEFANGNLDYVIEYDSTNEIGITVDAMNNMASSIKESNRQRDEIDISKKNMIAGLAHDLRTPLTSVKGYVEGLQDGIANTPEKQKQYLQTIYSSTLTMENLLNELQNFSMLELGKIQLEPESIELNKFLKEYVEDIQFIAEKKGLKINLVPSNEDIMVNLDQSRFSRVLTNILSNSAKYASTARSATNTITVQPYKNSVIISLADNGIGISQENIAHIFDTFFRADQARTRSNEGSGIGLAVCKEIVELHGGTIWATSEEGKGTTISISLQRNGENQ